MILSLYFACLLRVDEEMGRINGIFSFSGKGCQTLLGVRAVFRGRFLRPRYDAAAVAWGGRPCSPGYLPPTSTATRPVAVACGPWPPLRSSVDPAYLEG